MPSWYAFLFGPIEPEEPKVPKNRVMSTACAECQADITTAHCTVCDWFLCGKCKAVTEAGTGRSWGWVKP